MADDPDDPVERAARKAIEEIHSAIFMVGPNPHDRQRAARLIRDHLDKTFFPAPSEVVRANDEWLLRCYDFAHESARKHKNNFTKAGFVRAIINMSETNPAIHASQRRGAAGTNYYNLRRHLDVLLAKREKELK
jgi:hypothetical protein